MKKHRIRILLTGWILLLCACSSSSVQKEEEPPLEEGAYLEQEADRVSSVFTKGEYTLYYTTDQWTSIQEQTVDLDFSETRPEQEIERIITLLSNPKEMQVKDKEARSIVPDGLSIDFTMKEEQGVPILCLYMNNVYSQLKPNEAVIFRTGVSRAVFGLGLFSRIEYYASDGGAPVLLKISYAEDPVLLNQYDKNFYTDEVTLSLYFANEDMTALELEERIVTLNMTDKLQEAVVKELINGPQEEGHQKLIPEGTQILSVWIKDGVCYIDFNTLFRDRFTGTPQTGQLVIDSIVNSVSGLSNIEYVQILIDGERVDTYASEVPIGSVLTANPQNAG